MGTVNFAEALNPAGMLKPGWLSSPEVVQFISILRTAGIDLVFSGGAVRDAIRDPFIHPKDYDVFANAPAQEIHDVLVAQGISSEIDTSRNKVYVRINNAMFDIFRLPEAGDDRASWLSPENLRDLVLNFEFTLNTPVLTPEGTLYDFFGAIAHIHENRVQCLLDPAETLRRNIEPRFIMRYIRFCAQFGATPEPETVAACEPYLKKFNTTNARRKHCIRKDACLMLAKPYAPSIVTLLQEQGWMDDIYGVSSVSTAPLKALISLESGPRSPENLLRRLGAMLLGSSRGTAEALAALAEKLQFADADGALQKKLGALLGLLQHVDTTDRATRRILVKNLRKETLETLLLLRSAAEGTENSAKELYLSLAQSFSREGYVAPNIAAHFVAVRGGSAPYSLNECYGFTLLELSIVLVIIGLIVGSVVVGKDLIHASEVRSAISQFAKYNGEVNTFRAKYNCLPGDCTVQQATAYNITSNDPTNMCRAGYPGDGNGLIGESSLDQYHCGTSEAFLLWTHLQDAKLFGDALTSISSDDSRGLNVPMLKFNAVSPSTNEQAGIAVWPGDKLDGTGLTAAGKGFGGTHMFWITTMMGEGIDGKGGAAVLKPTDAQIIDQKVDDGNPLTGTALAVGDGISTSQPTTPTEGALSAHDCVNTSTTPASYNTSVATSTATSLCGLMVQSAF